MNRTVNRTAVAGLLFFAFFSISLFASGERESDDELTVVTTTNIITDVVRNVAGDLVSIQGLIPQGVNPHNYNPTPKEMARVEKADLLFVNGFGLEEALLDALENVNQGRIVEVSSRITPLAFGEEAHDHEEEENHEDEDEDGHDHDQDPHTWTSLLNVVSWTEVIAEALTELDPDNEVIYRSNAAAYIAELMNLDAWARQSLSAVKEEDRKLVSDHLIFGYFARDYGFENFGALIPSFSSNGDISAKDFSHLIEEVDELDIRAVFIGNTSGDALKKLGNVLVEESDHPIQVLPVMTGSLANEGEPGSTYLEYFEYNVNQIAKGLSGRN